MIISRFNIKKSFWIAGIFLLIFLMGVLAACGKVTPSEEVSVIKDSFHCESTYNDENDTTYLDIQLQLTNNSRKAIRQAKLYIQYTVGGERQEAVFFSNNSLDDKELDKIETGMTKLLSFCGTVRGKTSDVTLASFDLVYEQDKSQTIDETLLGVLIGSGLSLFGSLITIVATYFLERFKNKYKEKDYFAKKREEIYKRLYKLYASYSEAQDKESKINEILDATYEIQIYGSKKMKKIVDEINFNDINFKTQLDDFSKAIREELGVLE